MSFQKSLAITTDITKCLLPILNFSEINSFERYGPLTLLLQFGRKELKVRQDSTIHRGRFSFHYFFQSNDLKPKHIPDNF
jgi:hypothetical protein